MRPFLVMLALAGMMTAAQAQTDDRYPSWGNRMQGYQPHKEWRWGHKRAVVRHLKVRATHARRGSFQHTSEAARVIGGRPAGCPFRFCGCALSLKLFGRIVPKLNLAANWLTFPRAAPAPGMVAARRGHVWELLTHVSGPRWQGFDPNSGRGRTRIHERSIAGFVIVDPRGRSLSARRHQRGRA